MTPQSAVSFVAWLWQQHPAIVTAYANQLVKKTSGLGCWCFVSCIDDISCELSSMDASGTFLTCTADAAACDVSQAIGGASCDLDIQTLTCADLAQVQTCDVTSAVSQMCVDSNQALACVPSSSLSSTPSGTCAGSASLAKVASSLTSKSGLSSLLSVAASYFQSVAASGAAALAAQQAAVLQAQAARAAVGQSALPVTYSATSNGTTAASVTTATGESVPLTSQLLGSLTPSSIEVFLAQYGLWIAVAAAAGYVIYAARR